MPSAQRCNARIASNARSIGCGRLANSCSPDNRLAGDGRSYSPAYRWTAARASSIAACTDMLSGRQSHRPGALMPSRLFEPIAIGAVELPNRLVVAPMCQYSASDGSATDWHLQHLSQLAYSGAGLVVVEATAVERRGRITHACLGLYSDDNEATLERALHAARRLGAPTRFGIQLAHAGRKASTHRPWEGGAPLGPTQDPWQTVSSSAVAFGEGWHVPHALTSGEIDELVGAFVRAAQRAVRIGFDVIEVHSAHGYLLHEFLSPLVNTRTDDYGGSLANRLRFPLKVIRAVRAAVPGNVAVGLRISGTDWVEGGWDVAQSIAY